MLVAPASGAEAAGNARQLARLQTPANARETWKNQRSASWESLNFLLSRPSQAHGSASGSQNWSDARCQQAMSEQVKLKSVEVGFLIPSIHSPAKFWRCRCCQSCRLEMEMKPHWRSSQPVALECRGTPLGSVQLACPICRGWGSWKAA